jgi:aryl-alcohol dehydrogenase-like predicted oxidoreductase
MDYRNFGRTGMKVTPLCLGCMMFGGRTGETESMDIIDRALDAGINFLDTADVYSRGKSEDAVGKALKRNGKRDHIVLATKVHAAMDDQDRNMEGNHRRHIIQGCEASLRRLQTDWIDLYQIHRPSADVPIDETLRALDDLIRAGKVRYIGTSTFAAWQVMESLWASKELGLNRFVSEQPPYNLLDRRIERELVPMAQTYGLALIPWSPLAAGFLTGKYQRGQTPAEGRWAGGKGPSGRKLGDVAYDIVDKLSDLAKARNCTPSQMALAWCMHQPGITSPIIGPRTMEQLTDNLGALNVTITNDDRAALDAVAAPGLMTVKYYDADFGPHKWRW